MNPFRVHQIELGPWNYLLLPKLNPGQMRVLESRLADEGFTVQGSRSLSARSKEGTIRIYPSGLCRSTFDPADTILPAIPEMLSGPKDHLPLDELKAMYFRVAKSGRTTVLRLAPRMESSSLWDALRASGECGLTPDEHQVASLLMGEARGNCRMLTDFHAEESVPITCGRKRYYDTTLTSAEASSTLRVVGKKALRNSYLRRDGTLILGGTVSPSHEALVEFFDGLGEWCFFAPA